MIRRTKPRRQNKLLTHALEYAKLDRHVFPIHTPNPDTKDCSCGDPNCRSQGKHPRIKNWVKAATTDETQIRDWWVTWPDANIGLVTGIKSNIIVLDVDEGGEKELEKWDATPTAVCTTGNGKHLYFTHPETEIRNSQGFLPGLDIRGDGGCIVAPPSLHKSGKRYSWISGKVPTKDELAPCPKWLLKKAKDNKDYGKGYKDEADTDEKLYDQFCSVVTNSSDLINKRIERPKTILSPWLTDGSINEIYAPRGAGKTFLGLIISIAVTRENYQENEIGPWKVKNAAGVLYVDGEMGIYDIKERLNRLILPLSDNGHKENKDNPLTIFPSNYFGLKYRSHANINQTKWRDTIYRYLEENNYYQLLVLDNLSSLTSGLDENSNKEWGPINEWLLSMRSLGVAVIFVHHAGKSGQQRGASVREDNLDCVIKLKDVSGKKKNQAHFNISFEKSRNVRPDADLRSFTLKVEDCRTGPGDVWITQNTDKKNSDIVKAMLIDGNYSQTEIAELCDISKSRVSQIKAEAIEEGFLSKNGDSTKKGEAFRGKIDMSEVNSS